MKRAVLDLPKVPNISNIDNLERKEGITIKDKMSDEEFYRKLRWVTFGYHHDWDTKVSSQLILKLHHDIVPEFAISSWIF